MSRNPPEPRVGTGAAGGAPGAGGPFADLSANPRVPVLMELVHALSGADDPARLLDTFLAAMRRLDTPREYVSLSTRALPPGHYRIARWLSAAGKELVRPADPWQGAEGRPVYSAGFLSRTVASPTPKLALGLRIEDDPVFGNELAAAGAMLAVPYFERGEPAAWTLLFHPEPRGFTEADLEELILQVALVGASGANVQANLQLQRASAWILGEVDQIAQIQRSLLPQEEPDIPGLSFAAHYETFDRAGGDYYDVLPLRHLEDELPLSRYTEDLSSPWAIIIADASGHGPAAAVVVAMLHAILHGYNPPTGAEVSPAALLEYLNRRLFARRVGGGVSFVSAFLGIYDPVTRTLAYANAGHPSPLLRSAADGTVAPLAGRSGTPMGVRDEVGAADARVRLLPGDAVVLYTDGVVEAAGPDRRQFEVEGLAKALDAATDTAPDALAEHLLAALRAHEAGERPRDDQTIVVLRAV